MTDIVERLVALANALRGAEEVAMLRNAAAEIERLAADLSVSEANLNIARANLHNERVIGERVRAALQEIEALDDRAGVSSSGLFMRALMIARRTLEPTP